MPDRLKMRPSASREHREHRTLRWCPTSEQVTFLEDLFSGGLRNPSPTQIHRIVDRLSQFGKVQGRNVFYWFQNHKAREKQKIRQQFLRQHEQQLNCFYNNNAAGDVAMVPHGCCLSPEEAGGSPCVSCCAPLIYHHQQAPPAAADKTLSVPHFHLSQPTRESWMRGCSDSPNSTMEAMNMLEKMKNPLTLELFPGANTHSSLSSMRDMSQ